MPGGQLYMCVSVDTVYCTSGFPQGGGGVVWYSAFPVLHDMSTTSTGHVLLTLDPTLYYTGIWWCLSASHEQDTCILGRGVGPDGDEAFLLSSWTEVVGVSWLHR